MSVLRCVVLGSVWVVMACSEAVVGADAGDALPGLTAEQLARFSAGRDLFHKAFTPDEGLGPLYNQARCSSCHDLPVIGGSGEEVVNKATRFEGGRCDLLLDEGGDNIQQRTTPWLAAAGIGREPDPPRATERSVVTAPAVFGLGLIERIPDDEILSREDPDDADADGISGRAGRTADGRLARFGRKADVATIREFIDGALRFELGITTPLTPVEETIGGERLPQGADPAPDPEIGEEDFERLVDFVTFLAPVRSADAHGPTRDTLILGERAFHAVGCASCHVPSMSTGPDSIPALDRKTVLLYSDLLLHDLGPGLAGVCGGVSTPTEHRTARLTGVRDRAGLLHDGRGVHVADAVRRHGGEAEQARSVFERLDPTTRAALIAFVLSL